MLHMQAWRQPCAMQVTRARWRNKNEERQQLKPDGLSFAWEAQVDKSGRAQPDFARRGVPPFATG